MKIQKSAVIGIGIVVLIILVLLGIYLFQQAKGRDDLAKRIYSQESSSSVSTIDDLKASIAKYEKKIEQHVNDAAKTGSYWKILAVRLQDRGLHGEALDALQHAIYYTPLDASLQYYTGVSAGIMAKSTQVFPDNDTGEKQRYYSLAESAYLRAIELDKHYLAPKYGLAVLYTFELDRPADAIPLLQDYLAISQNDVDSMFVLARAYFALKQYQSALDLYNRIIAFTSDAQRKNDAQNNRQLLMGLINGK